MAINWDDEFEVLRIKRHFDLLDDCSPEIDAFIREQVEIDKIGFILWVQRLRLLCARHRRTVNIDMLKN